MKFTAIIAALLLAITSQAQTNLSSVPDLLATNSDLTLKGWVRYGYNLGKQEGFLNPTNYGFQFYGTYAASAPTKFGGGALLDYNVSKYTFAGVGLDWLGNLSIISLHGGLRAPFNLGDYTSFISFPWYQKYAKQVTITPFYFAGAGLGVSDNNNAIVIQDVGGLITIGHLFGGKFDVGAAWGSWNSAGAYSGKREHIFGGWSLGF